MLRPSIGCLVISLLLSLSACSWFHNDVSSSTTTTREAMVTGASGTVGAVAGAALVPAHPVVGAATVGAISAAIGYKLASLKLQVHSIKQAGGQVYQVGDYVTIVVPNDSLFQPNTAELLRSAKPLLNQVASILKDFKDLNMLITGNTDGIGPVLHQAKLSHQQALTVSTYLWGRGGETQHGKKIKAIGLADKQPIADPQTQRGMYLNRRIQITVYPNMAKAKIAKKMNHGRDLSDASMG
jgi:outer membrane protein OmpA-like peptidoglycan-associated protein